MSYWSTRRQYQCTTCWKVYMANPSANKCPYCYMRGK